MLPPVLQHMQSLGYAVFTGDYNLNLFGIRATSRSADSYDDFIGCAYQVGGLWQVEYWPATTDPGAYYLSTASEGFKVDGTAILVPGQYRGAYEVGPHGSTRYMALVQSGAPVKVYRDGNRDLVLDTDCSSEIEAGWLGINIHASSMQPYDEVKDKSNYSVGKWSGGCQVHATTTGFIRMMYLAQKQIEVTGYTTFSYTLLNQWS